MRGTKKDAEALLVQLLHQRDTGIDQLPGKQTVGQFLERWLTLYARARVAPKTYERYEEVVRLQLFPAIGGIPLSKLRPLHIQQAYNRVLEKGLSPQTALHCHHVLHHALKHALRWQLIPRNPADSVEPPRPRKREVEVPGADAVKRLLTAAESTPYGALVHLAIMTGLRLGELLGLKWEDVELETGVLHVRRTAQWLPRQGTIFREPKTHRSRRPVALDRATVTVVREHRRRQLEEKLGLGPAYRDHGLVFATSVGTPIAPSNLRRAWHRILAEAGVDRVRFHDLRHAHATLLLVQGIHPKVVSERLGHWQVNITLDTYSHVLPHLQTQAAEALARLLASGEDEGLR
jgi:integrase